ncbi:MAG TPA: hypothetical protein PLD25_32010 [Chloroflexota bacterium]|nr:hypothetical protein [Chloroflexota bacterium]
MTTYLTKLHEFLTNYYSLDELSVLCLELEVEFENLGGRTRTSKARELVLHLGHQRSYEKLLAALRLSRPGLFAQAEFNISPEALVAAYTELEDFEKATRSLTEKILIRVGRDQRIGFGSVIVILLIVSLGLYLSLREVGPGRMTGDFNIAVAPFYVNGEAGAESGEDVANSIYGRLHQNFEDLNSPIIQVWGPTEPRITPVRAIIGNTPEKRAEEAAQLAEEINADIVVYGVVNASDSSWQVIPEFYISSKSFKDAVEILGQHKLGQIFTIPGNDSQALRLAAGDRLTPRTEVLTHLAIGLTYYSISDYGRALENFMAIEENTLISEDVGAEVVFLLIGNTLGKQAQELRQITAEYSGESAEQEIYDLLLASESYYDRALQIDKQYARALVGKGSIAYLQAVGDGNQVDLEGLNQAVIFYLGALTAANKPALSDVDTKVHFGLGQSYLILSLVEKTISVDQVIAEFEAVIADYGDGKNPYVRDLAGEAHARLGLLYSRLGDNEKAVTEYEAAVALLFDYPDRQKLFQNRVSELKNGLTE